MKEESMSSTAMKARPVTHAALTRTRLATPLGDIVLAASDDGLAIVEFACREGVDGDAGARPDPPSRASLHLATAMHELGEYFSGERREFSVRLAPRGSAFDHLVWAALRAIPHGTTISYGALARSLGRPGAARAVGHANGRNPLAIIVPCHRVIASDGTLGGYAGGLALKRALLEIEAPEGPAISRCS
jgi:methylated-DNA-[protein]-cysteine S-methyltransferase